MSQVYAIKVSEQKASQIKKLTGRADAEDAIVELLTLAGRGEIQVRPRKADYAAALQESLRDEAAGRMRTFKTASAAMTYIRRKVSR